MTSGVYLDEPYANALIVMAFNEGYVRAYSDGKSDYEKNFIARFSDSKKTQAALQYLVLRQQVLIHPYFDNFDVKPLVDDGVFSVPDLGPAFDTGRHWDWDGIEDNGITYPTLSILTSEGFPTTAEKLQQSIEDGLLDDYLERIDQYYQAEAAILVSGETPQRKKDLEEAKAQLAIRTPIFSALNRVSKVLKASELAQGTAVWDCPTGKVENPTGGNEGSELFVAGIVMNGLNGIRVRSFSDALDLRSHPAIQEFRQEFNGMLAMFRGGELDGAAIKKRISKANRALQLAKLADSAGAVLTITGIPAMAWNPASIGVTIAGAIMLVGASAARHHFKWALLSNIESIP